MKCKNEIRHIEKKWLHVEKNLHFALNFYTDMDGKKNCILHLLLTRTIIK